LRIAVIGLGGTGAAAAWRLAREGSAVTAFEQFTAGHARGSSHGPSRIIRRSYEDPIYTRLMGLAYPLWDELERDSGEALWIRCGALLVGPAEHQRMAATEQALVANGVPHDVLDAPEVMARWPAFALEAGEAGVFEPGGGFLRSDDVVAATVRLAREAGARIVEDDRVLDVAPRGDGVLVRTERGSAEFDAAIVAAGAWIDRLVPALRGHLRVTRQRVMHLAVEEHRERFDSACMPTWIDARGSDYGFPADGRVEGVKVASHDAGPIVDPDAADQHVDLDCERDVIARIRRRLPDLSDRVLHAQACLYTWTEDEAFVLDRLPEAPQIIACTGCSGHGFKFTTLLGKLCADLALGRALPEDAARFSLGRLSG
jgi:sarcosine oxidase